jgi:sorting nexin-1/2
VGATDEKFIDERRNLLERFMKEVAKFDYITHSKEFRIFAREKGDIEKILNGLVKQMPMQVLEKYRLNFNIDEEQDSAALSKYKETIMEFQTYLRKVISVLEIQRMQVKKMSENRDGQDSSYFNILNTLLKYEEVNVDYYSEQDKMKKILNHPQNGDFKEKIKSTCQSWKNPFKQAYLSLKGELLDLIGLKESLEGREQVVKLQQQTEAKRRSD